MMSLRALLAALLLMLTGYTTGCNCNSGFRVTVPEALLKQINNKEVGEIERSLSRLKIPDLSQGGVLPFRISEIKTSNVGEPTSTLDLRSSNTIYWTLNLKSIYLNANWEVTVSVFGFSHKLSGSLAVIAKSISLSLEVSLGTSNGHLTISLAKCTSGIGNLDLPIYGPIGDLVNTITDPISNIITGQLEGEICNHVRGVLGDLAQNMPAIITQTEMNFVGIPLTLDNQFTNITIDSHSVTTYQKGAVKWSDKYIETTTPLPALSVKSDRLVVDIAQDTINNLMEAVITSGALDGNISYAYVMENNIQALYFNNCGEVICAGTILGDKVRGYPNGVLGVKWTVTDAHLKIKPGELVGTFKAIVNFTAETEHHQEHIVGAYLIASVPFKAKMYQDGLRIRPADVGGNLTIDSSKIGKVLGLGVQHLINTIAAGELKKKVISMFKDYETIIPIQLPPDITFRRNSLSFHEGVLRVEADICYKQVCHYETNDVWVGTYTTGKLQIIDILPTAVTSTATTTAVTSTATTTAVTSTATTTAVTSTATTVAESQSGGQTSSSGEGFVLTLSIALLRMMMLVLY